MGKKDKKKKGLGKAKTEAKEAKKANKARRKNLAAAGDDDVEAILASILEKEAREMAVTTVNDADAPSPRSSFTIAASTVADSDLVVFGGEHYSGDRTSFFSDLFVFNVDKKSWTRYDSATRPPPRSGHAVCTYKHWMFCFGGEFSNPSLSQYRHYRDLWRLDLDDMSWEKIEVRGGPSARSGHRMCVVKNKLVVFGGYCDPGFGENKYMNDMFVIDLTQDELNWTKVQTSAIDIIPSPRSGFQWGVFGEEAWLYGGYCRQAVPKAKSVSHKGTKKGAGAAEEAMVSRGVVHSDMYKLNGDTLKWQKVKRSGYGPSNRSGFSLVLHKRAMVVFGGVEDDETEEELASTFYNDIFGFSVDRKKWYPMTVRKRKVKGSARRRRKKEAEDGGGGSSSATLNQGAGSKMSDETPVVEKSDGASAAVDVDDDDDDELEEIDTVALEAAMKQEEEEEAIPCPRFHSYCAVQRNVMYIAGGVVEKKDSEVTLDDIWSVDLNKLDEFNLVKPLSEQCAQWVASDDEEEEDEEDDVEDDMEDDDEAGDELEEDSLQRKKQRKKRLQERVAQIEDMMVPRVFESLKDYHERTKAHWIGEVHEAIGESGKALRRIAFEWAYKRYWEMKPALKELEELEAELIAEAKMEEEFAKAQIDQRRGRTRR